MCLTKWRLVWNYVVLKHFRISRLVGNDLMIIGGPFEGMRYIPVANCSRLMPKIIGCYESAIIAWIRDIPRHQYDVILDIGCAEGYYAVGFAFKQYAASVYAYDIEEGAIDYAKTLTQLNRVEERITFGGLCTATEIETTCTQRKALIFCDIEGAEDELLDPAKIPLLKQIDLIVESHDFIVPGMINTLIKRFQVTHEIEIVGDRGIDLQEFPILKTMKKWLRSKIVNEGRAAGMMWVRLTVKR